MQRLRRHVAINAHDGEIAFLVDRDQGQTVAVTSQILGAIDARPGHVLRGGNSPPITEQEPTTYQAASLAEK